MRKPLEKVAKAFLPGTKSKRYVQTFRDQSLSAQANPRLVPADEHVQVECPFKSDKGRQGSNYREREEGLENSESTMINIHKKQHLGAKFATPNPGIHPPSSSSCPIQNPGLNISQNTSVSKSENASVQDHERKGVHVIPLRPPHTNTHHHQPYSAIPSPKGFPFFGTLFQFLKAGGMSNLHEYNRQRHLEHGPIYKEMTLGTDTIFVSSPQLFKQVYAKEGPFPKNFKSNAVVEYNETKPLFGLFFMNGNEWYEARKAVNHVFLKTPKLDVTAQILSAYEEYLNKFVTSWDEQVKLGKEIDIDKESYMWALNAVSLGVYGESYRRLLEQSATPGDALYEAYNSADLANRKLTEIPPSLAKKLRLKIWDQFATSTEYIHSTARNLAVRAIPQQIELNTEDGFRKYGLMYRFLTETNIPRSVLTSLATGFTIPVETVGVSFQWYIGCVANYPDVQEKIYQEILAACGPNTPLAFHHLEKTPTLKNTFKESMRMFPIAPFVTRQVVEPSVIGGYEIPAEKWLVISNYTAQRNAEYFPDPLRFWPERWERKSRNGLNPNSDSSPADNLLGVNDAQAFSPFGGGKRSCPGRILAKTLCHLAVGRLIQQFEIRTNLSETVMRTIMVPKEPIKLQLKRRT